MKSIIALSLLLVTSLNAEPLIQNLWPSTPPGPAAKTTGAEADITKPQDKLIAGGRIIKLGNVSTPQMHVFLPAKDKANGGALIVCPGGGFNILAWDLEGTEVAEWLNSIGFAAIVVKYRVPTASHGESLNEKGTMPLKAVGPVMDAQRAISLTRAHAAEWGLDVKRIGIIGFSAGGATAALTALQRGARAYEEVDAADKQSCAADFAMPIYPAYMVDKATGALNTYVHVEKDTPPMFLVMAQDDPIDSRNCAALYTALTVAKVPAGAHLYPHGGHGYGLRKTSQPVTHWTERAEEWLKDMGLNKKHD
jgi:acetyl esterase/lipase